MISINIHNVTGFKLGEIESRYAEETKHAFYIRYLTIETTAGSYEIKLFGDSAKKLAIEREF